MFQENARLKSLRLESRWLGPMALYWGDPIRLRQMLSNLVSNAIKFTSQGKIDIEAREVERDGSTATLEFSVSDTGIGISEDSQSRLFEPFSQVDSSMIRQYGGTGLGLSIVRDLAKLMGGKAGCESKPGQGSRFWFRIRADLDVEHPHPDKPVSPKKVHENLPGKLSGRVLVAEDNLTNSMVFQGMLSQIGMTSVLARNGQKALDAIMEGDSADLILMDLHMPILDGYTTTRRIREWEVDHGQARRPIIALTADAFEKDRQRCLSTGMDDFLTKPVAIEDLKAVLCRWLPQKTVAMLANPNPDSQPMPVDVPRV
ncbi:hypothetical protein CCP4SC76_6050001 [Gammaproteobacteria bacterium]